MEYAGNMKRIKNEAELRQIEIYKKMSADKKITIVDDFFKFASELQNDHKTISRRYQSGLRRA